MVGHPSIIKIDGYPSKLLYKLIIRGVKNEN